MAVLVVVAVFLRTLKVLFSSSLESASYCSQHGVPVVAAFGISCSTNSPSKLVYRVLAFCELSPLLCSTAPVDCRVNNKVPSVATASPVLARSAGRRSHSDRHCRSQSDGLICENPMD